MMKLTRRAFLKLAGVAAAAGGLGKLGLVGLQSLASDDSPAGPVSDLRKLGVCQLCAAGCGLSGRVVDGRLVKLDGNPYHPNNQGKLCPKGQAGVQVLYDPDRIQGPMRRLEEGMWASISWDEALGEVANALRGLRESGTPERLAFLHDDQRGATADLIARFCRAFGTPNQVPVPRFSADGPPLAHWLTQGWRNHAAYDWENTDYFLCFGGAFLEAWQPLVRHLRAYSRMRRGRPGERAKIVQIEPRASVTATKADEWLPVNPGTEGALALGMAHVILQDEAYDANFVARHTFGFEDWTDDAGLARIGFRSLVLRDYAPEQVARVTGVPAETIARVAREFAAAERPVAAGDLSGYTNSLRAQWAVHTLNALVGSIEAPGGMMRQEDPPLAPWPELELDPVAEQGLSRPRAGGAGAPLARTVPHGLAQPQTPVEVLFIHHANPVYHDPPDLGWEETLDEIPLVVSFSSTLDETSAHADLVLPDSTFLEKWFLEPLMPSLGYPAVGLGQPLVEPLHDTRNVANVLIDLAQRVGDGVATALPWPDFVAAIQERVRGLHGAGTGMPRADTFEDFWAELRSRGVWYQQPYEFGRWERAFETPSGRFEFASQGLWAALDASGEEYADEDLLPGYRDPEFNGPSPEYPFHLRLFKPVTYTERWGANLPWMSEIYGLHVKEAWGAWVEINPETAHELGIHDGERVRIEAPGGSVELVARLWPGTPPEIVSISRGQGHTAGGRWVEGFGANPNVLLGGLVDPLSGELAEQSTRVRVVKIKWE
jgi:anaerobic selenocysteine-containing dehydrogenase